MKQIFRNMLLL